MVSEFQLMTRSKYKMKDIFSCSNSLYVFWTLIFSWALLTSMFLCFCIILGSIIHLCFAFFYFGKGIFAPKLSCSTCWTISSTINGFWSLYRITVVSKSSCFVWCHCRNLGSYQTSYVNRILHNIIIEVHFDVLRNTCRINQWATLGVSLYRLMLLRGRPFLLQDDEF